MIKARWSTLLIVVALATIIARSSAAGQSPQAPANAAAGKLPLTTNSSEAKAEFWRGLEDWQSYSYSSAQRHFRRAYALDNRFALARVFATGVSLSPATATERENAVAEASRQSTEEGILALMWREKALGHVAQTRILLRTAMQLMPNEPAPAVEYLWSGIDDAVNPKQLADSARAIRARFPAYAPLALVASVTSFNAGDTTGALRLAEEWTRIAPQTPASFGYYGGLLQQLHRFDEAEAQYRKGVQLLPAHADYGSDAASALAEMYTLRDRTADARAVLTDALSHATQPSDSALYMTELATTYYASGENRRAMQLLVQAREKSETVGSGTNPYPLDIILAEVSAYNNDLASMRSHMSRMRRETAYDSAMFYANYAEVYAYVGQLDSAMAYSDRLATVTAIPWAVGIAHHTRGVALAAARQCTQARTEIAQAPDSTSFELQYARADCEFQLGNRAAGIAFRDRALASSEFVLYDPMYIHERRRLAQMK